MPAARQSRKYWIAAGSLAAHAALLAALAVYAPRLKVPEWQSGPPQAIIPVLIMPRAPPPAAAPGAKPAPIRLHRRPQRFAPEPPPVKPLVTPEAEMKSTAPAPAPTVISPPGPANGLATNARNALRARLGCANPDAVGLTAAEREACERRFAAGAKGAAFPGLGIAADKAADLSAAAARRERDYRYSHTPAPPPAGATAGAGASAEDLGKITGSDGVAKKVPF